MNAAIPERKPATEQISGLIERVTFHNDESGFCVLRVTTPGHGKEATVIGSLPSVTAGEWLVAEGWWARDKEHGLQFKASTTKTVPINVARTVGARKSPNGLRAVLEDNLDKVAQAAPGPAMRAAYARIARDTT